MPTLHMMAKNGARAERMSAVFPTVTWPNHTSMVTGVSPARHGVIGNIYYDRVARKELELIWDPVFDQAQIVKSRRSTTSRTSQD
jgi:predicted AlkP superfamily pyrophosphatase or phosphodiesterase